MLEKVARQIGMDIPESLLAAETERWLEVSEKYEPKPPSASASRRVSPEQVERLEAMLSRVETILSSDSRTFPMQRGRPDVPLEGTESFKIASGYREFRVGSPVEHQTFGEGMVVSVNVGNRGSTNFTVAFKDHGVKNIAYGYLRLRNQNSNDAAPTVDLPGSET